MEINAVVFEHHFDKAMLEQIETLRMIRLSQAESMLQNLSTTSTQLHERGLATDIDQEELRQELEERIAMLRQRLERSDVIYSDEISLYVDLLARQEEEDGRDYSF